MITKLKENEIFIFGSNLRGIHGAGAARQAFEDFDAEWGVGVGPTGKCYAIPTKDYHIKTLPLEMIRRYVNQFMQYALEHPELKFLVTPIGCGLAGYSPEDIASMFKDNPSNVVLPKEFIDVLNNKK